MTIERREPYCWVTWLTRLLSGDAVCRWAPWFRTHFQGYVKAPSTFNLVKWKGEHADVVQAVADDLEDHQGWLVQRESQNKFRMQGEHGVLSGQPDLVAAKPGRVRVIDVKTGKPRDSDQWQVEIYLAVLPYTRPEVRAIDEFMGEVYYLKPDDKGRVDLKNATIVPVPADESMIARVWREAQSATDDDEPPKTPSPNECSWCDIQECPARMADEKQDDVVSAEGAF
ncbi:hypothetical protein LCGC14_1241890 [marine sediment metagenome]|uniref:PD-(D/E)XK endonuclease-like domain-containing protein n=1 Tax=marine sediment metagenome TaxID=412755 RepID=A0A0F9LSS1_9ZZZZ